jgi:acetate kinase
MLGISGKTSDNQEIERLARSGDERAALCENMYCHQIAKFVGSYMVAMGGADAIVFTGGIGENNPKYRAYLGEKLAFLGVKIDDEKNHVRGEEIEISTPDSPVKVFVIPTNEELVIARDTLEIVSKL